MAKEWYVTIFRGETEAVKTNTQISVFMAIKSYCSNGKAEKGLSLRDIKNRSKVSFGTVQKTIPELIELGVIEIVGQEGHRGGEVNIYKVISTRSVKRSADDQLKKESDQLLKSSDQTVKVNVEQNKKEIKTNIHLTHEDSGNKRLTPEYWANSPDGCFSLDDGTGREVKVCHVNKKVFIQILSEDEVLEEMDKEAAHYGKTS